MMPLTFPAPTKLHGDHLMAELVAAGLTAATVSVDRDELTVHGVAESDQATVEQVVSKHVPPPPPPDPEAEFRAAVEAAKSVAELKAALLGTKGPGAQARRPT